MKRAAAASARAPHSALGTERWMLGALVLLTALSYWPLYRCDFITYDDSVYVTRNAEVQRGLTPDSVRWAFTTGDTGNWHPVTWLSLLADYQLYGLDPRGFHATNLLIHVLNVVLVLVALRGLTGDFWRSLLVAALFAVHPLRVESVAWVAERKDVLSALFALVAIDLYRRYVASRHTSTYVLMLVAFALSLMAKPMFVTLPFLLLLLDYWPLRRVTSARTFVSLMFEKLPLIGLALASGVVTFLVQRSGGTMGRLEGVGFAARLGNAFVAYVRYLAKMVWFGGLAVFYPHPGTWPAWQVLAAALLLAAISGVALWRLPRAPWLAVGWFWFLGTLIPVLGLVQVGWQSMADRFSYFPSIGLLVMLCWSLPASLFEARSGRMILASAAGICLLTLSVFTQRQVGYWRNSITLFEHALRVTEGNWVAHNNLGNALVADGKFAEAAEHLGQVIALRPDYAEGYNNLGIAYVKLGRIDEAVELFRTVLRLQPDSEFGRVNLATALKIKGEAR